MGARYFASFDARFLSVDPSPGNLENPQSQNRYNYTLNNPLKFVDPNGKMEMSTRGAFLAHTGFSAPDERNAHLAGLRGGVLHEQRGITTAPAGSPMLDAMLAKAQATAAMEEKKKQQETPPSPPASNTDAAGQNRGNEGEIPRKRFSDFVLTAEAVAAATPGDQEYGAVAVQTTVNDIYIVPGTETKGRHVPWGTEINIYTKYYSRDDVMRQSSFVFHTHETGGPSQGCPNCDFEQAQLLDNLNKQMGTNIEYYVITPTEVYRYEPDTASWKVFTRHTR
jgi:hypothetical protein